MSRFEVPACSVCYEYLADDLCVLSRCGHVYHRNCLARWAEKTAKQRTGCPLCRCDIPANGIVELKFECSERREGTPRSAKGANAPSDADSRDLSKAEVDDLKHRLTQAVTDKLDLQEHCASLENENAALQEAVLLAQDTNSALDGENKELKLAAAANKASISRLNDLVAKQKAKLAKLEPIHQYLKAEDNNGDGFNSYLKALSQSEKFALLTNRVAELEGINKTLTDLRDVWKKKCDKLSRDYLVLEREYKAALRSHEMAPESRFPPDPLNEATNGAEMNDKHLDSELDIPRKPARAIDFGFLRNGPIIGTPSPQRDVRPAVMEIGSPVPQLKAPRAKTQKISNFFKTH